MSDKSRGFKSLGFCSQKLNFKAQVLLQDCDFLQFAGAVVFYNKKGPLQVRFQRLLLNYCYLMSILNSSLSIFASAFAKLELIESSIISNWSFSNKYESINRSMAYSFSFALQSSIPRQGDPLLQQWGGIALKKHKDWAIKKAQ